MLQTHDRYYRDGAKTEATSSFDRWLKRTQRKSGGSGLSNGHDVHLYPADFHVDPRGTVLSPSPQPTRNSPSYPSTSTFPASLHPPGRSRLEELEGLLFTQSHYHQQLNSAGAVSMNNGGVGGYVGPDVYDVGHCVGGQSPPLPHTYRPLHLAPSEADFSSVTAVNAGGAGGGTRMDISAFNEPFANTREPFGPYTLLAGASEAEHYIARLEEEVQSLLTESSEKDRVAVAALAARDAMALQVEEARRRAVLERDEQTSSQTLTYSFLRTLSFHRILEERSRAMELNTQISVLKHELKLAETMRAQAQLTASSEAAAHAAAQELQRRLEEQQRSSSVTATVQSLLQQEYTRLAALMSEMPTRMQVLLDEKQAKDEAARASLATSPTPPQPQEQAATATEKESAEQRRLCGLLESALAAVGAQQEKDAAARAELAAAAAKVKAERDVAMSAEVLSLSDSARLLAMVSRTNRYQETVLDLYCDAVDAKASVVQYEMNLARLIFEKQSALTWATLYEEKKDEVRHLNEKLMELRGELRAATSTATTFVSPRGGHNNYNNNNVAGSFAGSTSSQSYEAYAAPYVPLKKSTTAQNNANGLSTTNNNNNNNNSSLSAAATARVAVPTKSIVELREEARRLGAHPAVHYPQPVTSPSPSMPSLYVSRTPLQVEQTVLKARSPEARTPSSPPTTPEQHPAKAPAVALIRAFAPRDRHSHHRSASATSFSSSSSSDSAPATNASASLRSANAASKRGVSSPLFSEMPATREAQMVVDSKRAKRDTKEKKTTPVKERGREEGKKGKRTEAAARALSPATSTRTSSSSSSSSRAVGTPATPVPASRSARLQMPTLHRVATTASSSSLSSIASASETKPSVGNVAASASAAAAAAASTVTPKSKTATPPPAAAPSATALAKQQAVHNSFDDDEDDNGEGSAGSELVVEKKKVTGKASMKQTQLPTKATPAATAKAPAATPTAAQVKRISLDATVRAMEKAKRALDSDDDADDTSSLSLSTTSSSASARPRAAAMDRKAVPATTSAATAKGQKTTLAVKKGSTAVLTAKGSHPRKSSFDDDGSDESDGSKTPTSTPPVSSLKGTPPVNKSAVPSLSLAASKTKPNPASVSAATTSKQPQKLKLPTW